MHREILYHTKSRPIATCHQSILSLSIELLGTRATRLSHYSNTLDSRQRNGHSRKWAHHDCQPSSNRPPTKREVRVGEEVFYRRDIGRHGYHHQNKSQSQNLACADQRHMTLSVVGPRLVLDVLIVKITFLIYINRQYIK